ncbi:MAG: hypothetical protein H6Q67_1836 [Firmicutes bacterium]|nr:hypothetical protein [Bacillota bacterium]
MDRQAKKKVAQWLYSIPRTELAIKTMEESLVALRERKETPPTWMSNPDALGVMGGIEGSRQETWVEFLDAFPARESFLEDRLKHNRRKVKLYYDTLDAMQKEHWGCLGREIVEYKYYRHVQPDLKIYSLLLFCAKPTYYRILSMALRFFYEVLQGEMRLS